METEVGFAPSSCALSVKILVLTRLYPPTKAAYMKILESSQTLLHVLKRESVSLTKKKQVSQSGAGKE
eukprot:2932131-Rhodomonas_salina.4